MEDFSAAEKAAIAGAIKGHKYKAEIPDGSSTSIDLWLNITGIVSKELSTPGANYHADPLVEFGSPAALLALLEILKITPADLKKAAGKLARKLIKMQQTPEQLGAGEEYLDILEAAAVQVRAALPKIPAVTSPREGAVRFSGQVKKVVVRLTR